MGLLWRHIRHSYVTAHPRQFFRFRNPIFLFVANTFIWYKINHKQYINGFIGDHMKTFSGTHHDLLKNLKQQNLLTHILGSCQYGSYFDSTIGENYGIVVWELQRHKSCRISFGTYSARIVRIDKDIRCHVRHERRKPRNNSSEGSSVDSESLLQCGMRIWTKSHNDRLSQIQHYSYRGQISDSARKPNLSSYVDTSSSDDDEYIQATQPRHSGILKVPKYDGITPFETFWSLFQNCSVMDQDRTASIPTYTEGDYGTEVKVTNSLK